MHILHVVGARPNFVKIAPLMEALSRRAAFTQTLVHTGQHYDEQMSGSFFRELGIPAPAYNLEVGSGTHAQQTAQIMCRFEPLLSELSPDLVVVVGDVNSTLACSLVAAKAGVSIAHVEAGLRSNDRLMPEEINRRCTDQLAELLFTPSLDANENLLAEGIRAEGIHFVGNIMIDTLHTVRDRAARRNVPAAHDLKPGDYALVTLHRPSNVDDPGTLNGIFAALAEIARHHAVVFPIHPRTKGSAERFGILDMLRGVRVLDPLPYQDMIGLTMSARLVLTDSGGLQEETTALGVPCLTLRDSTERPVTITQGTNTLVPDRSTGAILRAVSETQGKRGRIPDLWDGHTADRIVSVFEAWARGRG